MDIRKTFKRWSAYQQTVRELNALGNARSDIQRIARDHASAL